MKISDQLKILKILKKRLKGKCSDDPNTCPHEISLEIDDMEIDWDCEHCVEMFKGIVDLYSEEEGSLLCPCDAAGKLAVTKVNEYIEELKEEIKK